MTSAFSSLVTTGNRSPFRRANNENNKLANQRQVSSGQSINQPSTPHRQNNTQLPTYRQQSYSQSGPSGNNIEKQESRTPAQSHLSGGYPSRNARGSFQNQGYPKRKPSNLKGEESNQNEENLNNKSIEEAGGYSFSGQNSGLKVEDNLLNQKKFNNAFKNITNQQTGLADSNFQKPPNLDQKTNFGNRNSGQFNKSFQTNSQSESTDINQDQMLEADHQKWDDQQIVPGQRFEGSQNSFRTPQRQGTLQIPRRNNQQNIYSGAKNQFTFSHQSLGLKLNATIFQKDVKEKDIPFSHPPGPNYDPDSIDIAPTSGGMKLEENSENKFTVKQEPSLGALPNDPTRYDKKIVYQKYLNCDQNSAVNQNYMKGGDQQVQLNGQFSEVEEQFDQGQKTSAYRNADPSNRNRFFGQNQPRQPQQRGMFRGNSGNQGSTGGYSNQNKFNNNNPRFKNQRLAGRQNPGCQQNFQNRNQFQRQNPRQQFNSNRNQQPFSRSNNQRRPQGPRNNSFQHLERSEPKVKLPPQTREGDWMCNQCNNLNFAKRISCNQCGFPKPPEEILRTPISRLGPPGLFKEGDWQCFNCRNINFMKRGVCNKCGEPKPAEYVERERAIFQHEQRSRRQQPRNNFQPQILEAEDQHNSNAFAEKKLNHQEKQGNDEEEGEIEEGEVNAEGSQQGVRNQRVARKFNLNPLATPRTGGFNQQRGTQAQGGSNKNQRQFQGLRNQNYQFKGNPAGGMNTQGKFGQNLGRHHQHQQPAEKFITKNLRKNAGFDPEQVYLQEVQEDYQKYNSVGDQDYTNKEKNGGNPDFEEELYPRSGANILGNKQSVKRERSRSKSRSNDRKRDAV